MNLFKLKSSKNNVAATAQNVQQRVTTASTVNARIATAPSLSTISTQTTLVPEAAAASHKPGRRAPPSDTLVQRTEAVSLSSTISIEATLVPQAPVQIVPQRSQMTEKGMSIKAFNTYMDEVDRGQGLSKLTTISLEEHMAPSKKPSLLEYGMSDVEFLRVIYQCMKLRDSVEIHSTKSEKGAVIAATFLSAAPTLTYKRVHANKIMRRMWEAEPLIAKYLKETVNPSMRKQGIPLVWSTRPSEYYGVQLCASVVQKSAKPNRNERPSKRDIDESPDIAGMEKRVRVIGGIEFYPQAVSEATKKAYNLKMVHNIDMGCDPNTLTYIDAWERIGMPKEKLRGVLDDIFTCIEHHRASPTDSLSSSLTNINVGIIGSETERETLILKNQITVLAQNQAKPEIVRIIDHHNQDMVKNGIPVRFTALDFGKPEEGGTKRGVGGHNLGIYVPKDVFAHKEDWFDVSLALMK